MRFLKVLLFLLPITLLVIVGFSPWSCINMEAAQKTSAKTAIHQLSMAFDDYYEHYAILPLGSTTKSDTPIQTSGENPNSLMNTLLGLKEAADENVRRESFFTFKRSKGRSDGLLRADGTAELFDPWGNPYHLLIDYDSDNQIKDPFTGEIISDQKVLIWSLGPDGKSGTPETNKDNIYSWK